MKCVIFLNASVSEFFQMKKGYIAAHFLYGHSKYVVLNNKPNESQQAFNNFIYFLNLKKTKKHTTKALIKTRIAINSTCIL